MSQTLQELTEAALRLPPEDRVVLAESLLSTIEEEHDSPVDESTLEELERRLSDLREGRVRGIPAEEALAGIRASLKTLV